MDSTQYVAFLRAINVGGRVVKMTELKRIFEALKLTDVKTFIASGNVIFSTGRAAAPVTSQIEKALQKDLGYPVVTMIRSVGEVSAIADFEPFPPRSVGGASLYVGFMRDNAAAGAVAKATALSNAIDELRVHGREVYWLARKNISEATLTGAAIEKALQTPVTFRNVNTVRRLAAKYGR
jgi:uncharacterized protein (DUF1697 family)